MLLPNIIFLLFSWACKMFNCNGWSFRSSMCSDCNPVLSPVEHVSEYESMNSPWSLNYSRDCMSTQVKQLLPHVSFLDINKHSTLKYQLQEEKNIALNRLFLKLFLILLFKNAASNKQMALQISLGLTCRAIHSFSKGVNSVLLTVSELRTSNLHIVKGGDHNDSCWLL